MTRDSRTVAGIKGQMSKYSGIISKSLSKAKQRLIREMLYGIQAGKDIKPSCITRALNESIPLLKTEDRLSRNLDDCDFTDTINNEICRLGSRKVLDDMVIAIVPEISGRSMPPRWKRTVMKWPRRFLVLMRRLLSDMKTGRSGRLPSRTMCFQ